MSDFSLDYLFKQTYFIHGSSPTMLSLSIRPQATASKKSRLQSWGYRQIASLKQASAKGVDIYFLDPQKLKTESIRTAKEVRDLVIQ